MNMRGNCVYRNDFQEQIGLEFRSRAFRLFVAHRA